MNGRWERVSGNLRERGVIAMLVAGIIVSGLTALLGTQTASDGVIAVCAAAAGGVWLWRVTRLDGSGRRSWTFIALGFTCWGIAEMGWFGYDLFYAGPLPQPSLADPFYFLGYVVLSIGLVRLVIGRGRRAARASALDALALTIALGAILVQVEIIAPGVFRGGLGAANVLAVLYAVLDVPLLGGIAWLLLSPGRRGAPMALMAGGFAAIYIADVAYALGGLYSSAGVEVSNVVYPMAYLLASAAALHPATTQLDEPSPRSETHEDHVARLVFLAIALALPAFLELFAPTLGLPRLGLAGDVVTLAVSAVIVLRMARLLQEASRAQSRARAAHQTLRRQATRDQLTGLYNRAWLVEHLDQLIAGEAGDGHFALLYIDLDGFKMINDDLGHQAGDEMLRLVAARLLQGVRSADRVVRLGGDEFVVVCPPPISSHDAEGLAARVVALLSERFQVGPSEVNVTASVGVLTARARSDMNSVDLLRDADTALYRAKEVRSTWRVFNPGMRAKSENRLEILTHLRGVIRNNQLRVVYQPIVNLATGRIEGFEALARLTMPDGREIPPPVFVGIAESTGAALMLDAAVMIRALGDVHWMDQRCARPLGISVNLSGSEVTHPGLVRMIRRLLSNAQIDPSRLTVEVTETAVVKDLEMARAQLSELRALGVRVEIDDFGTGYSSMAYLHSLPISGIKIDRSFVQGALVDANQALITEGMIRMGKALGLRVVGEGVEETAQAQRMLALGCDAGQGYLFGRPMSREGAVEFVAQERTGARDEGSALAGGETAESLVGATGFSVGVPLVGAQITKRRDYAPRLDHELEEVSLDRLVGPPTVLDDPFIADSDDPAAMPHDLNGVGSAGGGADHSCGARDSEMS